MQAPVRATIEVEDELFLAAAEYASDLSKRKLMERALREFVANRAQERLASWGGSAPDAWAPERRRRGA